MLSVLPISISVCLINIYYIESSLVLILISLLYFISLQDKCSVISTIIELDSLSISLIILTTWLILLAFSATQVKSTLNQPNLFTSLLFLLIFFLILTFSLTDYILFYVSFEASFIPIIFIILGFGYQPERLSASVYLLFYTILGSLPLFFTLVYLFNTIGSTYMSPLFFILSSSNLMTLSLILAFMIKIPLYSTHLWLLKAHVEAPVSGSILLAGVLLKLGGYGLIRVALTHTFTNLFIITIIIFISLYGSLTTSLVCLRQLDIKILIAASSVVHINLAISSILLFTHWSHKAVLIIIVGHGLCSSGLFYIANIIYLRTKRRSLILTKGLLNTIPSLSFSWFMLLSSNMSAPPSLNLLREFIITTAIISWNYTTFIIIFIILLITAVFTLYLFSFSQNNSPSKLQKTYSTGLILEYHLIFIHWIPLNILLLTSLTLFYFSSLFKTLYCGYRDVLPRILNLKLNIYSAISLLLTFITTSLFFISLPSIYYNKASFIEVSFYCLNSLPITICLLFDPISYVFLITVSLISACVLKYSSYYMSGEKNFLRFIVILATFITRIIFLILSPNLLILLLGWDGLGLSSYLLVAFYQNEASTNAATLTILANRIGDAALILSLAFSVQESSWTFILWDTHHQKNFISLSLIIAALTKRAQIPFSAWLPAAIAAPTPVSALVHSSTLVTSGLYLLIRYLFISSLISKILFVLGLLTILIASLSAVFEKDLKKIIALSTLRQLGFILITLSLTLTNLAFFHLITHAIFKRALFLAAGFIIHTRARDQNIIKLPSNFKRSPLLSTIMAVRTLSLIGTPFLSAFYSKDLINELSLSIPLSSLLLIVFISGLALTSLYRLRLIFFSVQLLKKNNPISSTNDTSIIVRISILPLTIIRVILGSTLYWLRFTTHQEVILTTPSKILLFIFTLIIMLIAIIVTTLPSPVPIAVSSPLTLIWFSYFISNTFNKPLIVFSSISARLTDSGWLELYGPTGMSRIFILLSFILQTLQNINISKLILIIILFLSITIFTLY